MIERGAQSAVVVVLNRHETEWLQHAVIQFPSGAEDFRHAVNRSGLSLEGDFDEVTGAQRLRQAQQASSHGDALEFGFCTAAIFKPNRSQNRISKLDPGGSPRGVRLGEVSHRAIALSHYSILRTRLRRPLGQIPTVKREFGRWNLHYLKDLDVVYFLVNVLQDSSCFGFIQVSDRTK
jgi:hypothetical protein